jgi:hypothetical protein
LVVASSLLLFSKVDLSKSYQIVKNVVILVVGVLIWGSFAYMYLSSITSINKSVKELTKLRCKDNACQTARIKHNCLIIVVFLMFIGSIIGAFLKTYESLNGEMNKAKIIELFALDIDAVGHFVVLSSLLVLFHYQNKEQK